MGREERVPREGPLGWKRWEREPASTTSSAQPSPGTLPPVPSVRPLDHPSPLREVIEAEMKNFGGSIESTILRWVGGESDDCPRAARVVHTLKLGEEPSISIGGADPTTVETQGELRRPLPGGREREHHLFDRTQKVWILNDETTNPFSLDELDKKEDAASDDQVSLLSDGASAQKILLSDILSPREVAHTIRTTTTR